jgi:hypothetical protein
MRILCPIVTSASSDVSSHAIAGASTSTRPGKRHWRTSRVPSFTQPERSHGAILVNANSSLQRRRYTIGHELGHFLNPWHRPTSPNGFWCSREDMTLRESKDQNRHWRQEAEANIFAIELLAPRRRVRRYVAGAPDLERVLEMATAFDISREASARRYVSLHADTLAAVFSKEGRVRYIDRPNSFPWLSLRKDDLMPELPKPGGADLLSSIEEADPSDWLDQPRDVNLTVQTLHQQGGFEITLLSAGTPDGDDDDRIEDAFDRFSRRNR